GGFFEIVDGCFVIWLLVENVIHVKGNVAARENVHLAVLMLSNDGGDGGHAAGGDDSFLARQNYAELQLCFDAVANHQFVARLEDMQRQERVGKEHDIERKKRNTVRFHSGGLISE